MDESKIPYRYSPDPVLQSVRPLTMTPLKSPSPQKQIKRTEVSPIRGSVSARVASKQSSQTIFNGEDDFPPLGSANRSRQSGQKKNVY